MSVVSQIARVPASSDKTLRVWETATGKGLWQQPLSRAAGAVAISPEGKYVAT